MAKIFRYTPEAQKLLGTKTKPEPWLHVVLNDFPYVGGAIYVWDTRDIVEQISGHSWHDEDISKKLIAANIPKAKDNHQPLKGTGASNFTNVFGTGFNTNKAGTIYALYVVNPKDGHSTDDNAKVLLITRNAEEGERAKANAIKKYPDYRVYGYADTVKNWVGKSSMRSSAVQDAILKFIHNEQR